MPLWFVSCHNRSCENIASRLSMTPSPLPPFSGLSYSASARNPFGVEDGGCGVKLPNNSAPLSMVPLLFLSSTRKASSEPPAVQASLSLAPFELRSKLTPPAASVKTKPLPATSIRIGLPAQLPLPPTQQD